MTVAQIQIKSQVARIVEGLSTSTKIDKEKGIIYGVKLIGFESKNNRAYPAQVLKKAVNLYEGVKIYLNHPEKDPTAQRRYQELIGVVRNARFIEGSGNYGDVHYNPKHPHAEQLAWDVEHQPESVGLSHNALLSYKNVGGKTVVEEILKVRSVDLVTEPATTANLFESEEPMEVDSAPVADPKDQMKAAFKSMVLAAIDDSSMDMKATVKKIGEILKTQEKLLGVAPSKKEDAEEYEDEEGTESVNLKAQVQQLTEQLSQYQAKEKQAQLVEAINGELTQAGLDPQNKAQVSEVFFKQLQATESAEDRAALITDRAEVFKNVKPSPNGKPVYKPVTESHQQVDPKIQLARLRSRR